MRVKTIKLSDVLKDEHLRLDPEHYIDVSPKYVLDVQQQFQEMLSTCSKEFVKEYVNNKALIDNMLKALSTYKCEQAVKNVSVHFNRLKDGKNPDRVYIQARAAVPFKKGKRKWIGVYLGTKKDVVDSKDEIRAYWKMRGEIMVKKKMLDALKTELNLY